MSSKKALTFWRKLFGLDNACPAHVFPNRKSEHYCMEGYCCFTCPLKIEGKCQTRECASNPILCGVGYISLSEMRKIFNRMKHSKYPTFTEEVKKHARYRI